MSSSEQPPLSQASECIWYVLATIAGETTEALSLSEVEQIFLLNRHYWNGLMRERAGPFAAIAEMRLNRSIELPVLTPDEHATIRAALDARGFNGVSVPEATADIDFSNAVFTDPAWFDGFVFGGETNFKGARFDGQINSFGNAIFFGNVNMDDAAWNGDLIGERMTFVLSASFERATFQSRAAFGSTNFHGDTDFKGAHFLADVNFNNCEFADGASFAGAQGEARVDFRAAQFKGRTNFEKTEFKALVPEFFGATFNEHTEWHESKWPEIPGGAEGRRDQLQRYQCLARSMNDLEKFSDQHFFFRKELQLQRAIEGRSIATLMNLFYEGICDYGYGLLRVAIWWLGLVASGGLALCISKFIDSWDQESKWQALRKSFSDFHDALLLSFGHAHGFLDLNNKFFEDTRKAWEDVPWFGGIGAAQTILGVIILFFLLLTIRNRFRMR